MADGRAARLALCSLMTALGTVLMALGTVVPVATFCCPLLASLLLLPLLDCCGVRGAAAAFFATALLSLLLAPDKEAALLYLIMGWYPLLKPWVDSVKRKLLRFCVKLAFFSVSVFLLWLLLLLFGLETALDEMRALVPGLSRLLFAGFLLLGASAFFLYDMLLRRFAVLWKKRWKHKIWRHEG